MDRRRGVFKRLVALQAEGQARDARSFPGQQEAEDVELLDGFAFDYRLEPRCRICGAGAPGSQLPNGDKVRLLVDDLLVRGFSYSSIASQVAPLMEDWPPERKISYHSIRRHQLRHLRADELAVRSILERRARERGLRIVTEESPLVTNAAVFEVIRQRGFTAIARGELTPNVRETLEAARFLEALERETQMEGEGELARQVEILIEVIREHIPEEQWARIVSETEAALGQRPYQLGDGKSKPESDKETDDEQ